MRIEMSVHTIDCLYNRITIIIVPSITIIISYNFYILEYKYLLCIHINNTQQSTYHRFYNQHLILNLPRCPYEEDISLTVQLYKL